ncbi:SufE family protein [Opitutaceae bacterium]
MTLGEKRAGLIEDFSFIENRQERLAAVVERARKLPPLPEAERVDANRVTGCISQVWVVAGVADGRCQFRCDADGPLVKGLVAFLCELYSGATPAEILADTGDPLAELGLLRDLTPTRQNGLAAVRTRIRNFAESALN